MATAWSGCEDIGLRDPEGKKMGAHGQFSVVKGVHEVRNRCGLGILLPRPPVTSEEPQAAVTVQRWKAVTCAS